MTDVEEVRERLLDLRHHTDVLLDHVDKLGVLFEQPEKGPEPTRETSTVRGAVAAVSAWGILSCFMYLVFGDRVTSAQWRYLMSVPGGKWFWGIGFGVMATVALVGLWRRLYASIVVGMVGVGLLCLFICIIYLFASATVEDLFTLGWLPWLLSGGAGVAIGAMNRNDREW